MNESELTGVGPCLVNKLMGGKVKWGKAIPEPTPERRSMQRAWPWNSPLSPGAGGMADFAAKIGGVDFDGAAHFEKARAHALADTIGESIFANSAKSFALRSLCGFAFGFCGVEIVCGD